MKRQELEKIKELPYFSFSDLRTVTDENDEVLRKSISRLIEKELVISLKKGLYVTNDYFDTHKTDKKYREFIASILSVPSYLSLEYVLSEHDVLTEGVSGFTSVTVKSSRNFSNKLGEFVYKSIKDDLFRGYKKVDFGTNHYYVATKAKALFDFLYYKSSILPDNVKELNLLEELRLRLDVFDAKDFEELEKYIEESGFKKLNKIFENIKANAHIN